MPYLEEAVMYVEPDANTTYFSEYFVYMHGFNSFPQR